MLRLESNYSIGIHTNAADKDWFKMIWRPITFVQKKFSLKHDLVSCQNGCVFKYLVRIACHRFESITWLLVMYAWLEQKAYIPRHEKRL